MTGASVTPMPPVAAGAAMPWDSPVADPVAAISQARSELGDTFVVDSGPDRYLFTFDPVGVRSFYALPEERASKGVADWRMLRRKMPDEIFAGRRVLPHQLFSRTDVATNLDNVPRALDLELSALDSSGELDLFDFSRRLGHRIGLSSWGGPAALSGETFEALVDAFDALDGAESFVRPEAMTALAASDRAAERVAWRRSLRSSAPRRIASRPTRARTSCFGG